MGIKGLVEGIILQSLEDLWHEGYRDDSVAFFKSKDFSMCADIAGMNLDDQVRMLKMVKGIVDHEKKCHTAKGTVRRREPRPGHQKWHNGVEVASCR
ncbi:MAG: hypothetical protein M0Z79_10150 [Nitrospiraceae bacterium]|nr:hypothetical protein [Nitrospiraceae bacterium]